MTPKVTARGLAVGMAENMGWWSTSRAVLLAVRVVYWGQFYNILTSALSTDIVMRPDQLFENGTFLYERMVTCGERPLVARNAVYPAETLSCYDMRIDGSRMLYWHMDGLCSDGLKSMPERNDLGALCRSMLEAHHKNFTLWAAMIGSASCARSTAPRVELVRNDTRFEWDDYPAGHGYVISLHCIADPDGDTST